MMRYIRHIYFLLASYMLLISNLHSQPGQCLGGGCNTGNPFGATQSTTSNVFVNSVAGTWAGEYNTYNVTAGQQYEWSLCPGDGAVVGVANTQLTLTNNITNALICYSDNVCGNHAKILWTATFTGVVRVYIHSFNCAASSLSHTVRWRCVNCTSLPGSTCANALNIASVPFTQNGMTTCGYGNDYNSSNACFSSYMSGDDFVYSYTPATNQCINVALSGTLSWTGVFITNGCPTTGTCVAQATSVGGNPSVTNVNLIAGNTYYIVISTWPSPDCTPFNISITTCTVSTAGSTCANPVVIPAIPYVQNGQTTCGFGNDYNSSNACFSSYMNGDDFVYTYTPPVNQCVSISLSGTLGWTGLFVTNGCPTVGTCVAQNTNSIGNPGISNLNLIGGVTYYIIISTWPTPNCTPFNITINPCTGPVTAADCPNAVNVCTNLNFSVDPNGYGTINELCTYCTSNPGVNPASGNFGCLLSGELNSTWMIVNIATSGVLQFSFGNTTSGSVCYDWIMWPYTPTTCSQIVSNTIAPIRCNWNSPCVGFTGISVPPPAGGNTGNFEPNLAVTAGQQYIICFSNYSSATTTVPLNFFGTASVSCTPLDFDLLGFSGTHSMNNNILRWDVPGMNEINKFYLQKLNTNISLFETIYVQDAGLNTTTYTYNDADVSDEINYYRLIYTSNAGVEKTSEIIAVGSNSLEPVNLIVYPNPFDEFVTLELKDFTNNTILQITDVLGKPMHTQNIPGNTVLINTSNFAKGIYFVSIKDPSTGEIYTTKTFVKK